MTSESSPPAKPRPAIPDSSVLQDRMPDWFRSTKAFAGLSALLLAFFLFLSTRPLWHTDIWGHLAYGRALWESDLQVLWGDEPLMELTQGVRFVDTAWLSQLIGYASYDAFGAPALQLLFSLTITACFGILAWRFYQRTGSVLITLLGLAMLLLVAWQQLFVNDPFFLVPAALIRPQIAGWLCYVILFALLTSRRWRKAYWVLIPALFAAWANLHGSFLVGLLTLGCFLVGRGIDIERRTGKIKAISSDRWVRRYFVLLELSAVAVLLNPYGLEIYAAVLAISSHPNMQGLIEWDPLTLRSNQGTAMAFAGLILMFLYRWSPRRIRSSEVLLLTVFGGLTLYYSRFMTWWAPLAAYYLVLHGNAVLRKDRKQQPVAEPEVRKSLNTVICLGLVWIAFALTPFSSHAIHGHEVDLHKSLGNRTPIRATEFLTQRAADNTLPRGLVFHTYEWGDYLLWAGPRDLPVFVASHVHFLPETIWSHYFDIVNLDIGYERLLDAYGINVVVLSKAMHDRAIERLQRDGPWQTEYEDDRAVIFFRRIPI